MAGVLTVLLVLAFVRGSLSDLRCGNWLPITPTITDKGIILCRALSTPSLGSWPMLTRISSRYTNGPGPQAISTPWSRNCYTCQEYSSDFFLERFPGLFFKSDTMLADTGSNNQNRARRPMAGIQTNNCCDTNWQMENHPFVTTNQAGNPVYPITLWGYVQKAAYGRCDAINSDCMTHKKCTQHFVWISVLVWQLLCSPPFKFDLIQIPASCICVG